MTGFLLDTHTLLWWAESPEQLSSEAKVTIGSGRNTLYFSYASIWELSIKIGQGKMTLPDSVEVLLQRARCQTLPIELSHLDVLKSLPPLHGDPFDRLLVAQAQVNKLTLITRDQQIQQYDVTTMIA